MNLCTRVIPQSLLEINKIEINDKTLQLPIPSVTGNLRPSDKIRKDLPPLPYSTENQQFHKEIQFRILRFNRYRICKSLQYSN